MRLKLDEEYEPRTYACGECHRILGVVMRDTNRMRHLWIFTLDRAANDVPPTAILRNPPRGLYKVHQMDAGKVQCECCGALTEWVSKDQAFDQLMSHYSKKV